MAVAIAILAAISLSIRLVAYRTGRRPTPTFVLVSEYATSFCVAGLTALVIVTFIARPFWIPSESMVPTLKVSDVLMVDELRYRLTPPAVGDIAVFHPPIPSPEDFIKRVIAVPGETLRVADGHVYRDGRLLDEPYASHPDYTLEVRDYQIVVNGHALEPEFANLPPRSAWNAPDRLPANCYMMFGDNRNDSLDSHAWGCAQFTGSFASGQRRGERAGFTGRAEVGVWPANRLRLLAGDAAMANPTR